MLEKLVDKKIEVPNTSANARGKLLESDDDECRKAVKGKKAQKNVFQVKKKICQEETLTPSSNVHKETLANNSEIQQDVVTTIPQDQGVIAEAVNPRAQDLVQVQISNEHLQIKALEEKWSDQLTIKGLARTRQRRNEGIIAGGGIILDFASHGIAGFSNSYGVGTNLEAETHDLLEAVNLCLHLNLNKVKVELDSQILVLVM
ncbi:hypothetical protein ACH5RR_036927 [Cinchona calisaya]|uniref:RNase H type-1 domain-containing protein n=1 Tax=Cinchona calisaya TaxID=153742 RepID=A0ABD2Y5X3_9GENT